MKSQENGNVLFLILIAVALFAALSYAVTSSTRSGGGSASKDKAKANAALIVQHGTAIRNAVMRVKLSGNCTDTTLDFSNDIYKKTDEARTNEINANAPSSCYIYSPNGGNIVPLVPNKDALGDLSIANSNVGAWKYGHGAVRAMQLKGIGTDGASGTVSANDLVFWLNYINRDTCLAINTLLNVDNPNGDPPISGLTGSTGQYVAGSLAGSGIFDNSTTNGNPAFCQGSSGSYIYYHALVER